MNVESPKPVNEGNDVEKPKREPTLVQRLVRSHLRVHDDLTTWTAKQHIHSVEHIAAEYPFITTEVCLKTTLVIIAIQMSPHGKHKCGHRGLTNPTDQTGHSLGGIKLQLLAISPRQSRRIGTRIRDYAIESNA